MSEFDSATYGALGILAVFLLVFANGFFVAAEFSLVGVRKSRVDELARKGKANAKSLQRALKRLDANLAATQLGITISSLGLGWIGEPALARLIEPLLAGLPASWAVPGSHAIAVTIAFLIITALHIVLGELAPKSLALQRAEKTSLWVVRPLAVFRFLLWPAIFVLNGLGNRLVKFGGLRPGGVEESLHSPEELRMLITASGRAGLLHEVQQEVAERIIEMGQQAISTFMTPRPEVEWIDSRSSRKDMLDKIKRSRHGRLVVSRGSVDNVIGIVRKQDLLDQALAEKPLDPLKAVREPLIVHEVTPVLKVIEEFKRRPVHMGIIVNEYGTLEGIVTQTNLLEALAGDIEGAKPKVSERPGGRLVMEGSMLLADALERLGISARPKRGDFHTLAGFALFRLGRIPEQGDHFTWQGWRFEVAEMDGPRIKKMIVSKKGA